VTAAPAVISGSRRAVRLVLGATAAVVAALVLVGLLVAVLAGRSAGSGTALGLGLGAAGAALLAAGLLVVARAGALSRRPAGAARGAAVLTRCVLAATVGAVAMAVIGVVAVSGSRAVAPGVGAGVAALLLFGLAVAVIARMESLPAAFVGGMLIGGSAGSTAGGIKVVRHLAIARLLRRELDQTVHPELVSPLRLNGRPIEERALQAIVVFAFVYVGALAVATTILMIDATRTGLALTPFDALAAVAASQCNGGAALGFAGPFGSFDPFSDLSKAVLIIVMWLGRLEIVPVLVLFSRRYWRA